MKSKLKGKGKRKFPGKRRANMGTMECVGDGRKIGGGCCGNVGEGPNGFALNVP